MIDYWKMSYTEYSQWIMSTVSQDELNEWKKSTTEDWIRESVCFHASNVMKLWEIPIPWVTDTSMTIKT